MKKTIKLTTTLLGVCALSFFNLNCGGDKDAGGSGDTDASHEEGDGHAHEDKGDEGKEHEGHDDKEPAKEKTE